MCRRRATVATPGEWQCGVRRLAVANGPNIFQMLLVYRNGCTHQACFGLQASVGLFYTVKIRVSRKIGVLPSGAMLQSLAYVIIPQTSRSCKAAAAIGWRIGGRGLFLGIPTNFRYRLIDAASARFFQSVQRPTHLSVCFCVL